MYSYFIESDTKPHDEDFMEKGFTKNNKCVKIGRIAMNNINIPIVQIDPEEMQRVEREICENIKQNRIDRAREIVPDCPQCQCRRCPCPKSQRSARF